MHIHILGIGGTFMAGVAILARAKGHYVTGSDQNLYPPMSDVLDDAGISVSEGYHRAHLLPMPDLVIIGNALSRGNEMVEFVLDAGLPYQSGPEWIADNVLRERWVIAVAGTHGKTTTTSLIAYLLRGAGYDPGFLIGGMVPDLGSSAYLGNGPFFVIEADEYDTAFFDKRSKFVHYKPRTLVLNNLEFDHADIFPDLDAIKTQFHHLVRTIQSQGRLIVNAESTALQEVLDRGCYSKLTRFGTSDRSDWRIENNNHTYQTFDINCDEFGVVNVESPLTGRFNAENVCAAFAALADLGCEPAASATALPSFKGVKRRLEVIYHHEDVIIYDDFAHHPTAIQASLNALRAREAGKRIIAVVEARSNTMRMGIHRQTLPKAAGLADLAFLFQPAGVDHEVIDSTALSPETTLVSDLETLLASLANTIRSGDRIVIMSNGAFGGLHQKLVGKLKSGSG